MKRTAEGEQQQQQQLNAIYESLADSPSRPMGTKEALFVSEVERLLETRVGGTKAFLKVIWGLHHVATKIAQCPTEQRDKILQEASRQFPDNMVPLLNIVTKSPSLAMPPPNAITVPLPSSHQIVLSGNVPPPKASLYHNCFGSVTLVQLYARQPREQDETSNTEVFFSSTQHFAL